MNRIKKIRKKRGLRQVDLAVKSGLSLNWIWLIENGGRASKEAKEKVAKVLQCEYEELFPNEPPAEAQGKAL